MAITTFTNGQVLTAAQQNALQANDYNQTVSTKTANYVLVAADKGTRVAMNAADATTITVNTDLFAAGDTLIIQNIGAGTTTVTANTATVASAGSLAIPTNGSGTLYFTSAGVSIYFPSAVTAAAGGLVFIRAQTIGSAVSSVPVTDVFSSTYDNYKIIVSGGVGSTNENLQMILGASTTGYYSGSAYITFSSGAFVALTDNAAASWSRIGGLSANAISANIDLLSPNLAKITTFNGGYAVPAANQGGGANSGFHNSAVAYTGFTITAGGGATLTGGIIRVYGYQNS